ncbi:hypothetical protein BDY24DRAFT_418767 [Mrakia frigida]|uniref:uncharacterized protein n=1 Tax=Mrakia frigida TaxID=29902 RepID=UPI003FCC0E01
MPLPLSFVLLPTTLSSPQLTPLLAVELNGVKIYRTLDPEPGEPFVSSSLLLLSQSLPPILALTKYECRLPLGYDTSLSGLAPFPDIWIPLATARTIAKDLGVLEPLGWLLSWKTRAMSSWFEGVGEDGGGVVAHNWRLPEDRADPSAYSHQTLLSTPITSNIDLLPAHQTILTLLSPTQLTTLLSSTSSQASAIPPTPLSHLWPTLILLTTESFESYLSSSSSSSETSSSTVLASLVLPFLHLLGAESAFPSIQRDELVKLLGGRRGLGEEGRRAWVKGVEVLGGLLVGLMMGEVRWEVREGKGREVVLPLKEDEEDEPQQQQQATTEAEPAELASVAPLASRHHRRNGKEPTRPRSSSPSPPSRPVDSTRLPSPVPPPPLPSTLPPSSPSSTQLTPSSSQISSQLSTLIAQIEALSTQIETQRTQPLLLPPPPSPSSVASSSSSMPSPPPSPPTSPTSRSWILVALLLFSNLAWLVLVGLRGGRGGGGGLVASSSSSSSSPDFVQLPSRSSRKAIV